MTFTIGKGLSAAEYHAHPGVSNSQLGILYTKSEAHLRHYLDNPTSSETPAKAFGSALHSKVLTPKLFERDYFRRPERGYAKSHSAADRKAYEHILSQNQGRQAIDWDDWITIRDLAKVIAANPKISALLSPIPEHWREVSLFWQDPSSIVCKARLDAYSEHHEAILDLKTTKDASPGGFARSIASYGYARQAAYYMRAARTCNLTPKHFIFIAVEKEPPFACGLYRITDRCIEQQYPIIDRLIERYARANATGEWPDYAREVSDIETFDSNMMEVIND